MAADASRSAASADSYIGSLISLTSKSEIRYEGLLFNINTEESSIGLRNVRSFGTEGRKKDGTQIPPSDKIFEYILFRGSDIKDLQVKSSPPVQPPPMHNDPAIIQSHYPHPMQTSASMPSSGSGYAPDIISRTVQVGMPRATFQGGLPLYQPPGDLGSWGTSPVPPTANGPGISMPMYWPGFYPPSGLSHVQQPPFIHPPDMQISSSMDQPLQYPGTSASLLSVSANLSGVDASLPSGSLNLQGEKPSIQTLTTNFSRPKSSLFHPPILSSVLPSSSPPVTSQSSEVPFQSSLLSSMGVAHGLPTSFAGSQPFTSSLLKTEIDPASMPDLITGSNTTFQQATPYTVSTGIDDSSSSKTGEILAPSLVTPAQLSHSGAGVSLPYPPQISHKESEKLKAVELSKDEPAVLKLTIESQEALLPTPAQRANGASAYAHNFYRNRGRGRGRGNELARSATKFTEDFDFDAMNEKFNKEEVWGHLGKNKGLSRDGDNHPIENGDNGILKEYATESSRAEVKPVYVKDDFFDTLSCHSLEHANHAARANFSEQRRYHAQAFADLQRDHPTRGGHGFRGGRSRGSFYGRGYGYAGGSGGYSSNYRV